MWSRTRWHCDKRAISLASMKYYRRVDKKIEFIFRLPSNFFCLFIWLHQKSTCTYKIVIAEVINKVLFCVIFCWLCEENHSSYRFTNEKYEFYAHSHGFGILSRRREVIHCSTHLSISWFWLKFSNIHEWTFYEWN